MNKAEILELASADRLSAFCDQWERGRHNGDEIHCIGNGAGVEICLTVTDIRSVVSALRAIASTMEDDRAG
ncbi:hypothetical protein CJD35_13485 [Sphingobium xenophagum]|uniref:Uncharacterized protein n=1 Tax=Sphingobium xenophagum TaxID=121428 RepID=A0A249MVE0_SPHXE|nr:hypothetical protein [Sphingobium xenophagum]ASY45330.1 hypothetical protein CJD35_13485 [Sphingobium xenophagum]